MIKHFFLLHLICLAFFGLDKSVLLKSLAILVDQRRAQLLNIGSEAEGVKFLP